MNVDENLKNLVCSNCSSDEIELIFGQEVTSDVSLSITGMGYMVPLQCKCKKCGFTWIPKLAPHEEDKGRILRENIATIVALFILFFAIGCFIYMFLNPIQTY